MRLPRRTFLRGAGSLGIALPFLGSIAKPASAVITPGLVKRFITIYLPYGTVPENWFPTDDALVGATPLGERGKGKALTEFSGDLSTVFPAETFAPLYGKMTFLDGVDGPWAVGHTKPFPLTGYDTNDASTVPGDSLDQIIAHKADIYESEPAHRILLASPHTVADAGHGSYMSFRAEGDAAVAQPHIGDPSALHSLVFEGVVNDPEAIAAFERLKAQRLSTIDFVHEDYRAVRGSTKLSGADRQKLDAYMQHLRDFELSIESQEAISCTEPPTPVLDSDARVDRFYPDRAIATLNILSHAIRCGVTNVVSFAMEPRSQDYGSIGADDGHHSLSHCTDAPPNPSKYPMLATIDGYHMQLVADFVKSLDVVEDPDSGRTFLDNSIVFVTSDMGSQNHRGWRIPTLLFGGTGVLRQGTHVDFRSGLTVAPGDWRDSDVGVSYSTLLVTLAQAMGLTPEQYEQGQAGIGLYQTNYYANAFASEAEYEHYAYIDKRTALEEMLA